MAEQDEEPQPFHKMSDDYEERLNELVQFWERGEMDYPADLNPTMEREFDKLTGNRKNLRILVPLCGKDAGMKWLSEKGHYVVGVDLAEKAAIDFFKDNNLEYTVEDVPSIGGKRFTSKTGKLKYYSGNFFHFSPELEGQFDVIWDAAGFVSLDKRDWNRYLVVFRKLLTPDCIFLFEVMQYDTKKYKGPPYSLTKDEVKEVFGTEFPIQDLVELRANEYDEDYPFSFYCLRRK